MAALKADFTVSPSTRESTTNDIDPPPDLGTAFFVCNMILNGGLGVTSVLLNSVMMIYHKGQLRDTIPFTYFTLNASDLMTGICALLHSVIFLILLVPHAAQGSAPMFCLVAAGYILTVISFRVSCFVSLLFAAIRTINIVRPFQTISHKLVVTAIVCYTTFWVAVLISEIYVLVRTSGGEGIKLMKEALEVLMMGYFYDPSSFKLLDYFLRSKTGLIKREHIAEQCTIHLAYTVIPVTLCAVLAGTAALVQLYTLKRRRQNDNRAWVENASVTIALITLAFVLCSSTAIAQPIFKCLELFDEDGSLPLSSIAKFQLFYMLGYTPFFINALLNPLIFACRVKLFKSWIREKLTLAQSMGDGQVDRKRDRRPTCVSSAGSESGPEPSGQVQTNL